MKNHKLTSRILLSGLHGANYNEGYLIGSGVAIVLFIIFYLPLELDTLGKYFVVGLYVVGSVLVLSNGIFNPIIIYLHFLAYNYTTDKQAFRY